jgi:mRNA-degrading endonuclease YafQ of YafQ-DinJ toxin-antitoxin module
MYGIADGSVRTHTLHGAMKGSHAARISQAYRLVFALEPDTIVFIDIGSHDEVY